MWTEEKEEAKTFNDVNNKESKQYDVKQLFYVYREVRNINQKKKKKIECLMDTKAGYNVVSWKIVKQLRWKTCLIKQNFYAYKVGRRAHLVTKQVTTHLKISKQDLLTRFFVGGTMPFIILGAQQIKTQELKFNQKNNFVTIDGRKLESVPIKIYTDF